MILKNTKDNYGAIAKSFHWASAIVILLAYISVYYRHWLTETGTPDNWTALQLHLSFGVTLGVLVILRIIWRLSNTQPTLEPGSKASHLAAHLGHIALYAVLIIMPLTGYIGTSVDTEFFFQFNITKFDDTPLFKYLIEQGIVSSFEEFERPIDFIHKQILGAWLCWLLIVGHIGAAIYHHVVLKDRTLLKMSFIRNRTH